MSKQRIDLSAALIQEPKSSKGRISLEGALIDTQKKNPIERGLGMASTGEPASTATRQDEDGFWGGLSETFNLSLQKMGLSTISGGATMLTKLLITEPIKAAVGYENIVGQEKIKPFVQAVEAPSRWLSEFSELYNSSIQPDLEKSAIQMGLEKKNVNKPVNELLREDASQGFLKLGIESVKQIPQLITTVAAGETKLSRFSAAGTIGSTQSIQEEYEKDKDVSGVDLFQSGVKGIVEGLTEMIFDTDLKTLRSTGAAIADITYDGAKAYLKNIIKSQGKKEAKEAIVRTWGGVVARGLKGTGEEALEEGIASVAGFVVDSIDSGKLDAKDYERAKNDFWDSMLIGGFLGGGISTIGATVSKENLTKEQERQISKLQEVVDNETIPTEARQVAKEKIDDIYKYNFGKANDNYKLVANLPVDQRVEVLKLTNKIEDFEYAKSMAKTEDLIATFDLKIEDLDNKRKAIFDEFDATGAKAAAEARKTQSEKDIETASQYFESSDMMTNVNNALAPIQERLNNNKEIDENELDKSADELYAIADRVEKDETLTPEQKALINDPIFEQIQKLDGYEFATKTNVTEVTQRQTTKSSREIGRVERQGAAQSVANSRWGGNTVTVTAEDGTVTTTVAQVTPTGKVILKPKVAFNKKSKIRDEQAKVASSPIVIDTNFTEFVESKFDEDGNVSGAVLRDNRTNTTFEISNPDLALDIALKAKQDKLGTVSDAIFEQAIKEETVGTRVDTTTQLAGRKAPVVTQTTQQTTTAQQVSPTQNLTPRQAVEVDSGFQTRTDNPILNTLGAQVKSIVSNAYNALKSISPQSKMVIYDNEDSMIEGLVNEGVSRERAIEVSMGAGGLFNPATGNVHINKNAKDATGNMVNTLTGTTIPHEVAHAVLLPLAKQNPKEFIQMVDRILPFIPEPQRTELQNFAGQYEEDGIDMQAEEFLSQLAGMLTKGEVKFTPSTLHKIRMAIKDFVQKVAKKTNNKALANLADKLFPESSSAQEDMKFFNDLARSIQSGSKINNERISKLAAKQTTDENLSEQDTEDIGNIGSDFNGELYEPTNLNITGTINSPAPKTGRAPQIRQSRGNINVIEHPTFEKKNLVGKKYSVTMSDHTKVGEYVNEKTGVRVENLMGGVFYPYIKGIRDAGLGWASVTAKAAREMVMNAANQDYTLVYRMNRSTGSRGNHNFNEIAIAELIAPVTNGKITEQEFLKEFNEKLNTISNGKQLGAGKHFLGKYGKDSGKTIIVNKTEVIKVTDKKGKLVNKTVPVLDKDGKNVRIKAPRLEINSIKELSKGLAAESFSKRGGFWSTVMKDSWGKKSTGPWYKFLETNEVTSIEDIVNGLAEEETDSANDHDVVSVLKLDKPEYDENGNVKIYTTNKKLVNESKGIYFIDAPNHPSYPYVVKGQPVGLLDEFNPISDYFPVINKWIKSGRLNSPYKAVETMGRELISSRDKLRQQKVPNATQASKKAFEQKRKFDIKKLPTEVQKWLFDRQINIRRALRDADMEFSLYALVNKAGAAPLANFKFQTVFKDIYGGLTKEEVSRLDDFVFLRRVIAIDANFDNQRNLLNQKIKDLLDLRKIASTQKEISSIDKEIKDLKEKVSTKNRPLHPLHTDANGKEVTTNKESAEKTLEEYKTALGEEAYNKISDKSNKYFQSFSDLLKYKYDNGLINKEEYDMYKDYNYSPRKFFEHMFGDTNASLYANRGVSLNQDEIKGIKDGSLDYLETDSMKLLHSAMVATEHKVMTNKALKTFFDEGAGKNLSFFKELNYERRADGSIATNKDGSLKFKEASYGFTNMVFKVNGVNQGFQLQSDLANEFSDVEKWNTNHTAYQLLSKASGAQVLRQLATGMNIGFFITNIPIDLLSQIHFNDVYNGGGVGVAGNYTKAISGTLSTAKSLIAKNKATQDLALEYAQAGGLMMTQSQEGTSNRPILNKVEESLSYLGNISELASKLNAYKSVKEREIAKYKEENNGNSPDVEAMEKIKSRAAYEARGAMDFHRGGLLTKYLDGFIPYLNVAFQGTRITVEYIKNNPVKFFNKIAQTGLGVIAITLYNMMVAGDEWDNDDLRQAKTNKLIIFSPFKNSDGTHSYSEIPVPTGVKMIWNLFQNMGEGMYYKHITKTPEKLDGILAKTFSEDLAMMLPKFTTMMPPTAKAIYEYKNNKNLWTNRAINYEVVNTKDEGRFDEKVLGFYKMMAKVADKVGVEVSPVRTQKAVEDMITNPHTNIAVGLAYTMMDKFVNLIPEKLGGLSPKEQSKYSGQKIGDFAMQPIADLLGRATGTTDKKNNGKYVNIQDIVEQENKNVGSYRQEVKFDVQKMAEDKAPTKDVIKYLTSLNDVGDKKFAANYYKSLTEESFLAMPSNKYRYGAIAFGATTDEARAKVLYATFPNLNVMQNEQVMRDLKLMGIATPMTMMYYKKIYDNKGVLKRD